MPHGKLIVILEDAIGIKDASKHGRGNSYCTLQCGSQVQSTHVAEGCGSHPIFHTEFKFKIDRSTNDLVISVYSVGSTGKEELVGTTTLVFKTVFFHAHVVPLTAYPLTRRSGKAGGHINVSLTFKARPSPYANDPHAVARQSSAPIAAAGAGAVHHLARNQQYNYEDGYGSSGSGSSSSSTPTYRRSQSQPEQQYYDDYYDEADPAAGHAQAHQYHHARPTPLRPTVVVQHAQPNAPHRAIPVKRPTPPPPPPPHMALQYAQRAPGPVYQGQIQGPVYQGQQQGPVYQGQGRGRGQGRGLGQGRGQGRGQGQGRGRGRGRGGRGQQQQWAGMIAQGIQGVQALGDVADMVGGVADLAGGIGDMVGGLGDIAGGLGDLMGGLFGE